MDINIDQYLDNRADPNKASYYYGNNNEFRKISTARKVYQETPIAECLRRDEECRLVIDKCDRYDLKTGFSHTLIDEIQKEFSFDKINLIKTGGSWDWGNQIHGFKTKLKKLQTERQRPDWLPHVQMNVPSLSTHFRFGQNFIFKIENTYGFRAILEMLYSREMFDTDTFDGVKYNKGVYMGDLIVTEGSTAKVTDFHLSKEGMAHSRATIKIEKGATLILNGKSIVLKKSHSETFSIKKFNEIYCQFNAVSL